MSDDDVAPINCVVVGRRRSAPPPRNAPPGPIGLVRALACSHTG
jgi:hypothetical protein